MTQPIATNSATLDPQRSRALELVLEGRQDSEIALVLNVDRSTVWRWRQEAPFRAELLYRGEQIAHSAGMAMERLVGKAIGVLEAVLDDASAPMAARIKAATEVLDRNGIVSDESKRNRELLRDSFQGVFDTIRQNVSPEAWSEFMHAFKSSDSRMPTRAPLEVMGNDILVFELRPSVARDAVKAGE